MVSPTKKYTRSGQYSGSVEPQTKSRNEPIDGSGAPRPPGGLDRDDAALDARIRLKGARGEPLDDEERAFLARLPGDSSMPPEAFDHKDD